MTISKASVAVLLLALIIGAYAVFVSSERALGSVPETQEYMSTTTYALSTAVRTLRVGTGALAQVTITGANTGLITIYNATTSNASLRAADKATSTIVIADFPVSTAAGTYTFDARYTDGLLVVTSGAPATSTITWR